ncbi:MAG: tyrosine-type recombinase/integrase [Methylococcales bacterium]|jgi:integrase
MKYISQKTPNSVYSFRRRIPTDLITTLLTKEFKCSLKTKNSIQAQANAQRINHALELKWSKLRNGQTHSQNQEQQPSSLKEAQQLLDSFGVGEFIPGLGDLGREHFLDHLADKQPHHVRLPSDPNEHHSAISDHPDANLSPTERKALQILQRTVSLSDAIDYYIQVSGKQNNRKFVNSAKRSLEFFTEELGDKPLDQYRRKEIEDRLHQGINQGLKTATISRRLSDVKSAVNKTILNFEYQFKNPFEKHTIPNLREDENSRSSLDANQQHALTELFNRNDFGNTVNGLRILFDSGMRVSEVIGLRTQDIYLDQNIPHIKLLRNPFRPLKTKQSERLIPLVGLALIGVKKQLNFIPEGSEWLFPNYINEDDKTVRNDSASAAMNKRIKPLGFTCHSLRHNLKDRLRLANVSMENIKEIQGWSRGDQASKYGEMSLLELLYKNLKKIEL